MRFVSGTIANVSSIHSRNPARNPGSGPNATSMYAYGPPVIDTFTAAQGEGLVWLHGYGNVFEVALAPGEQIDIEPGGWVYKDPSVRLETQFRVVTETGFFFSAAYTF